MSQDENTAQESIQKSPKKQSQYAKAMKLIGVVIVLGILNIFMSGLAAGFTVGLAEGSTVMALGVVAGMVFMLPFNYFLFKKAIE